MLQDAYRSPLARLYTYRSVSCYIYLSAPNLVLSKKSPLHCIPTYNIHHHTSLTLNIGVVRVKWRLQKGKKRAICCLRVIEERLWCN